MSFGNLQESQFPMEFILLTGGSGDFKGSFFLGMKEATIEIIIVSMSGF